MPSTTSTTEQSQDSVPVTAYRKIYGKSGLADALRLSAKPSVFRETAASNVTSSRAPVSTASDIRDLAWSPLGSLIATADSRILRVWNSGRTDIRASTELKPPASELAAASKNSRTSARLHLTGTERVVWNPAKEAELASVGNDACLRFWDVRTRGQVTGSVKIDPESSGLSLAWRPERAGADEVVVLTKDDRLHSISRRQLSSLSTTKFSEHINHASFMNSGNHILVSHDTGPVDILEYPTLKTYNTLRAHPSSTKVAIQDSSGDFILTGGTDANVTRWNIEDMSCGRTYPEMCTGVVRSLSFSFDGSYIVAGDESGETTEGIKIVHAESSDDVYTIKTNGSSTPRVQWHPNRYYVAYSGGGEQGALKIVGSSSGIL